MKITVLILVLLATLFCRCNNGNAPPKRAGSANHLIARDFSIDKNNSYTGLFLDSADVEQFITQQQLNDTLSNSIRNFYNSRNYQFAWFAPDGLTEQAYGFRSLYDYSSDPDTSNKALDTRLDILMAEDSLRISGSDAKTIRTELLFTTRFIQYVWDTYNKASARSAALVKLVPAKKYELLQKAEAVISEKDNDQITHSLYTFLKDQLGKYVAIAKKGGWPVITAKMKKYSKGVTDSTIVLIKKRLQATGQLAGKDTTALFNDELESAVKTLQGSYGYTPDGIVTTTLINDMNIPAISRVQQILINLERMKWIPEAGTGRLIMVNIPEFKLHVWEGKSKAFDMNIVVGKEGHSTTLFSGSLNQVVLSPYWNLPPDIVRKEVLPDINENSDYLAMHNMEITGERNGLPVIRQLPGDKNELGKVKFIFPNSFNIYFHDTPHKDLFKRDKRAYSHGCIRLSNPVQLANYLLKDQSYWTPEKIDSAMNSGKEKYVQIKDPVPVLIYYYTAWVDENGILQFRDDIYGHDEMLAEKLFTDPQKPLHD